MWPHNGAPPPPSPRERSKPPRRGRGLRALPVALAALLAVAAQTQAPPEQVWRVVSYLDDAELQERGAFALDFESDGTTWIASSDGLLRYDGYQWRRFTVDDGLPSDHVRSVLVARDGRLWVGTDSGAGTFDGQRFEPVDSHHLAGPSVRRIAEGAGGELWFCSDKWPDAAVPSGLARLAHGAWKVFREADGLPDDHVYDVFVDGRGRTFVLTHGGPAELVDETLVPLPLPPGLDTDLRVMAEHAGRVVGLGPAWLLEEHDGGWTSRPHGVPIAVNPCLAVAADGELLTFARTDAWRFLRWNGEGFEPATEPAPAPVQFAEMVAEAPDGAVWAVGMNLVVRWERRGGEWTVWRDLPPPRLRDGADRVWFADETRALFRADGAWFEVDGARAPLACAGGPTVWARGPQGLRELDGERAVDLPPHPGLEHEGLELCATVDGDLWTLVPGPEGALLRWNGSAWRRADVEPRLLSAPAEGEWVSLRAHPEGGVLAIGREDMPWRFRAFRLGAGPSHEVPIGPARDARATPRLTADGTGRLWLHGHFGLLQQQPDDWAPWSLPGRDVFDVAELGGEVWFACSGMTGGHGAVARLGPRGFESLRATVRQRMHLDGDRRVIYSTPDGVAIGRPGEEELALSLVTLPTRARADAVVAGPEGELWIGSRGEVFEHMPDHVAPETLPLVGSSALVAGEELSLRASPVERFRPRDDGRRFLVSQRVDGGPWSRPIPHDPEDLLVVPDLAEGRHAIEVRFQDEGGDLDPTPARFEVEVQPVPYQQRWWFLPLALGLLAVIATLAVLALRARRRLALHNLDLERTVESRTRELRQSEHKYRGLFDQSGDAILLLDPSGRVLDANPAAGDLLGVAPGGLEGRVWEDLFEGRAPPLVASDGEPPVEREARALFGPAGGDGAPAREVAVSIHPRRDRGSVLDYQAVVRDVALRKQLEEHRNTARKMEAVSRMAGGVAHDFNNLLTGIVGFGELLAARLAGRAEARDVDRILQAADRARTLADRLQTFGRGHVLRPVVCDLNEVARAAAQRAAASLGEHVGLTLDGPRQPVAVRVDPRAIEEAALELVANAREALPDGRGGISIATAALVLEADEALELGLPGPGSWARLEVADDGRGMDEETRAHAFEPFFSTQRGPRDPGLGLSTVYAVVTQSGGAVRLDSAPGDGTRVQLHFPLEESLASAAPPPPVSRTASDRPATVLVVDDEPAILALLELLLEDEGHRVLTASDGIEAERLVRRFEEPIDLLLTDLVMPRRSGWELAAWIRSERPETRVLLMTGYADAGGGPGAPPDAEVLRKPFTNAELRRRVREALGVTV